MNRRIQRLGGVGGLLVVAAAATIVRAAAPEVARARPVHVTIGERQVPVYPGTLPPTLAPKRSAKAGSWRLLAVISRRWRPAACTARPSWRVRRASREGRYKDDVPSFRYHGREVHLRSQRTKGFQKSIFNDEIKGAFDIELWRELDPEERKFLEQAYAHLSAPERKALMDRLTRLRTGEMQPYYIMRYGFYEGHTEYRVDPVVLAALFGLKSLTEIERAFRGELDQVLATHFTDEGQRGLRHHP